MPFFVDDWLSSDNVDSFTLEQQGAYLRLLARQWKARDGYLPKDEATLARWSGLGARWRKVGRPILEQCFVERAGGLVNPRCRRLWEQVKERSSKARDAAEIRWERERQRQQGVPFERPEDEVIWDEMKRTYGRCLRCKSTTAKLCRDHVIPRYQGGADTPQNWQPLCPSCNSSKGPDRTDYRRGLPETRKEWLP
jgi:uncharacterized protein YdaU (DUF1376 family)